MSESTQKKSIELIDAIESILLHKSCPLSLDYLSLKLQKKYVMKSVTKSAFVYMVHTEISKYPHRIYPTENGLYILANPSDQERSTLILPDPQTPVHSELDSVHPDPIHVPGCDEELEIYQLTQEVALLKELNAGCLAWNHSLAGLITERRRELEEVNTDVTLLLASYHATRENTQKNTLHKKKYNKKYGKSARRLSASGKRNKKRVTVSERKHKLKVITVKKSKLNSSTKYPTTPPHRSQLSSPPPSEDPPSDQNSQSNSSGSANTNTRSRHSPSPYLSPTSPSHQYENLELVSPNLLEDNLTSNDKQETTSSDSD